MLTGEVGQFWLQFGNTIVWTVACVVVPLRRSASGLAVLLNRPFAGRSLYRVLLIVPWAVPAFVSAFAWRFLFDQRFGLINASLEAIGLSPVAWFDHRWTSLFTAIVTNVWLGVPFMMVALLGGLQSIPGELYEAAEIDGATPVAAVPQHHPAGPAPGQHDGDPARHDLDLQHVPDHLLRDPRPARRPDRDPGDRRVPGGLRGRSANYSLAATYGVLILSMLIVFATVYRRALRSQGDVF